MESESEAELEGGGGGSDGGMLAGVVRGPVNVCKYSEVYTGML